MALQKVEVSQLSLSYLSLSLSLPLLHQLAHIKIKYKVCIPYTHAQTERIRGATSFQ